MIARIDPAPFQARVDQAQANLDAAQAAVVNARGGDPEERSRRGQRRAALANAKATVVKTQVAAGDAKIKADRRVKLAKEGVLSKEDGRRPRPPTDRRSPTRTPRRRWSRADNVKVAAGRGGSGEHAARRRPRRR